MPDPDPTVLILTAAQFMEFVKTGKMPNTIPQGCAGEALEGQRPAPRRVNSQQATGLFKIAERNNTTGDKDCVRILVNHLIDSIARVAEDYLTEVPRLMQNAIEGAFEVGYASGLEDVVEGVVSTEELKALTP
jgi:hypothetical protein